MAPTPVPTPPPLPVAPSASPNQTLVVNLPPDVVDRLTPHTGSGLSQPWATIIAAAIAIAAAIIAYFGVRLQVRSAANQAAATRKADDDRAVRSQQIQLLSDALDSTLEVLTSAHDARTANTRQRRPNVSADVYEQPINNFRQAAVKANLTREMLQIYGLKAAAQAVASFNKAAMDYVENPTGAPEELTKARFHMLDVFADTHAAQPDS